MTPEEFCSARHRLGLSTERLAALGEPLGTRLAASGRTIRRWENGSLPILAPAVLLIELALALPEVRRLLGAPAWVDDGEPEPAIEALPEGTPEAKLAAAHAVLRRHHQWHLDIGDVILPAEPETGMPDMPIDLSDAYIDSALYDATVEILGG